MEILHVAHRDNWEAACRGRYEASTRGRRFDQVGFIHCSLPHQLAAVAEFVYADDDADLCVLVMDEDIIRESGTHLEFEDGGDGELYPHIYGPIHPDWVSEVRLARFDAEGRFRF